MCDANNSTFILIYTLFGHTFKVDPTEAELSLITFSLFTMHEEQGKDQLQILSKPPREHSSSCVFKTCLGQRRACVWKEVLAFPLILVLFFDVWLGRRSQQPGHKCCGGWGRAGEGSGGQGASRAQAGSVGKADGRRGCRAALPWAVSYFVL